MKPAAKLFCRILRLHDLRPMLGLSILELTPQEMEELIFDITGPYQLPLWEES